MLVLLYVESKARGFVLRIADDARRRSSSTRGKGFAGSREFIDRDRLRHRGFQHRQQRDGLVRSLARRGLWRAALGDHVEDAVRGRLTGLQPESAVFVGLTLRQLRRRAGASGVKRDGRPGDRAARTLDGAR